MPLRTVDGRVPGERGLATRKRLLEATHDLISEIPYRDLTVIEISRRAGTSPATFYQYFADVESAVLALAAGLAGEGGRRLRALVDEADWTDHADATALVAGFLDFFDRERALLRVIDLAALEGDERFRALRTRLLFGVFLALDDVADDARARMVIPEESDAGAIAGVLTSMLAHVAAHRPEFEAWGVATADLAAAMAAVVDWSIRGSDSAKREQSQGTRNSNLRGRVGQ